MHKQKRVKKILAIDNPTLAFQWHPTNNKDLTPYDVTSGSGKRVWWKCESGRDHEWEAVIAQRNKGNGCPFCSGRMASETNNLYLSFPEVGKLWHPTKNGKLTPFDVTCSSKKKVWWRNAEGIEYERVIKDKTRVIKNRRTTKEVRTTECDTSWKSYPELIEKMLDKENHVKYGVSNEEKMDWVCPKCKEIIRSKKINNVRKNGLSCPYCSDGKSYPEKFMLNFLKEIGIEFQNEIVFEWNKRKRYDFYIPSLAMIIEVHGIQHYDHGFGFQSDTRKVRSVEENKINDAFKKEIALKNNIQHYVEIDARKSSPVFIRNSIQQSVLMSLFEKEIKKLDWQAVYLSAENSLVMETNKLWNSGIHTLNKIAEKLSISRYTVRKYLKRGKECGWNDYCEQESKKNFLKKHLMPGVTQGVVRIAASGEALHYSSVSEATTLNGIKSSSDIYKACKDKKRTVKGYRWMENSEYDQLLKDNPAHDFSWDKHRKTTNGKSLIQLTMDDEFVAMWDSLSEAGRKLNIANTTFSKCAKGTRKSVGGYKWMYQEDYERIHSGKEKKLHKTNKNIKVI